MENALESCVADVCIKRAATFCDTPGGVRGCIFICSKRWPEHTP